MRRGDAGCIRGDPDLPGAIIGCLGYTFFDITADEGGGLNGQKAGVTYAI
jgi:hypothetical protein